MIRSMTGYGRSEVEHDGNHLTIEVSSVNHRYLDISVRLPKPLGALETKTRKAVQERVARGKVTVNVNWDLEPALGGALQLNAARVADILEIARNLKEVHNIAGELDVATVMSMPDVITEEEAAIDLDAWWRLLSEGLDAAIDAMMVLKMREGDEIARDMLSRVGTIEELMSEVERRAPDRVVDTRERLRQRIAQIVGNGEVDPYRLEQEVAFQADRLDCTEECVRLRSHLKHFRGFAGEEKNAGRRLNFLLQEMNREATTIGAKANDAELAIYTVQMKEELERIREQVQNVE